MISLFQQSSSEVVHKHIYNPRTHLHLFGKPKKTEGGYLWLISCSCPKGACSLRNKGECALNQTLGGSCPYGSSVKNHGPSQRAKGYRDWELRVEEIHKGVPYLKSPEKKLAVVGDLVYLPYSHMNFGKDTPFDDKGGFFHSGTPFIRLEAFTVDVIFKLVTHLPMSLFGGPIYSYRTEEVPRFLMHLKEEMPNKYEEFCDRYPEHRIAEINPVGRTAYLLTMPPCKIKIRGRYADKYPVEWNWDGSTLTTNSEWTYQNTWGEVKEFDLVTTSIKPNENTTIVISDKSQVSSTTKFKD